MEKQIKEAFDSISMSDTCEEKILGRIRQQKPCRRWLRYAAIAAACLLVAGFLLSNPQTVQALEAVFESVSRSVTNLFHGSSVLTQTYVMKDGKLTAVQKQPQKDNEHISGFSYKGPQPDWLEVTEEGLYFVANGERINIGSRITEEIPFTYSYTDPKGKTCYYIVGGTYIQGEELTAHIGFGFWMQAESTGRWLDGYSVGTHDPQTGENRIWFEAGKQILGIPYP